MARARNLSKSPQGSLQILCIKNFYKDKVQA